MNSKPKILIYGYGNPGRQDDGLGPVFVDHLKEWIWRESISYVELDSDYQLNFEDALTISEKDIVVFADASIEDIDDFCLTKVCPEGSKIEFTMHAVSASFILDLCNKLYNKNPETYLLHIKGYEWDYKEELTEKAQSNLNAALAFIKDRITDPDSLKDHVKSINA